MVVLCPKDAGPLRYCHCSKGYTGNIMISCDFCNTWFHGECVGIMSTAKDFTVYFCGRCKTWNKLQYEVLSKAQTKQHQFNEITNFEKKWREHPLRRSEITQNPRIIELLYLGQLCEKQSIALLKNSCLTDLINDQLNLLRMLPLNQRSLRMALDTKRDKGSNWCENNEEFILNSAKKEFAEEFDDQGQLIESIYYKNSKRLNELESLVNLEEIKCFSEEVLTLHRQKVGLQLLREVQDNFIKNEKIDLEHGLSLLEELRKLKLTNKKAYRRLEELLKTVYIW